MKALCRLHSAFVLILVSQISIRNYVFVYQKYTRKIWYSPKNKVFLQKNEIQLLFMDYTEGKGLAETFMRSPELLE